jgi:hypothetical protein
MIRTEPPIEAVAEVCQLNRLFLDFVRDQPEVVVDRLGLSARSAGLLRSAEPHQIHRAASFPRALFGLSLPPASACPRSPASEAHESERVIRLVLLHSARNLSRMSGYWARLLFRLEDEAVERLRAADVEEIVAMSEVEGVVRAAFGVLDRVLPELLIDPRPEHWRRLLLLGFQPDFLMHTAVDPA